MNYPLITRLMVQSQAPVHVLINTLIPVVDDNYSLISVLCCGLFAIGVCQ